MDITSIGLNQVPPVQLQTHSSSPATAPQGASSIASTTQPQQKQEAIAASREELQASVDAMNNFVQPLNNSLQFSVDDDTGKTVVKVVDLTTDEVIRQMPSEEALAIAKALDKLKGLLIQQQV